MTARLTHPCEGLSLRTYLEMQLGQGVLLDAAMFGLHFARGEFAEAHVALQQTRAKWETFTNQIYASGRWAEDVLGRLAAREDRLAEVETELARLRALEKVREDAAEALEEARANALDLADRADGGAL